MATGAQVSLPAGYWGCRFFCHIHTPKTPLYPVRVRERRGRGDLAGRVGTHATPNVSSTHQPVGDVARIKIFWAHRRGHLLDRELEYLELVDCYVAFTPSCYFSLRFHVRVAMSSAFPPPPTLQQSRAVSHCDCGSGSRRVLFCYSQNGKFVSDEIVLRR